MDHQFARPQSLYSSTFDDADVDVVVVVADMTDSGIHGHDQWNQ